MRTVSGRWSSSLRNALRWPRSADRTEQGFDILMSSERGLAAHRDVPADIRAKFSAAVKKVVDDPIPDQGEAALPALAPISAAKTGEKQLPKTCTELPEYVGQETLGDTMKTLTNMNQRATGLICWPV